MDHRVTGHLEELSSRRDTWRLVANLPPVAVAGRRRYPRTTKTIEAHGVKAAREALADWLSAMRNQGSRDARTMTVARLCEAWLEAARWQVRPKTLAFYPSMVDRHVVPVIGEVTVATLTPTDLMRLVVDRRTAGLSETTVHHVFAVTRTALTWAVNMGILDTNPATKMRRPPQAHPRRRTVWSDDQIAVAIAASRGLLVHVPLILAAWAGMRRGEICALRWDNVNLDAGLVTVTETMEQVAGKLSVHPPKGGLRDDVPDVVPLPSQAVEILRAYRAAQNEYRLAAGKRWNADGHVICRLNGQPVKPDNLSSAWHRFCRTRKMDPVTFHDLRHSYASGLFEQGGDDRQRMLKIVQQRLRHTDPATTARI
jgi:integrase